ncbi:MAG: LysM repeat protein [Paracoccaceae bacterium]|jgi:LysM repeat protein
MRFSFVFRHVGLGPLAAIVLLAGCSEPFDYDLRGNVGAFNTSKAARGATTDRPKPDDRGIISYPNYQVAVAERGDSVTDVATRIGLPAGELARYNGIDANDKLRQGEVLALPRRVAESSAASGVNIESLAGGAIDAAADTTPVVTTRPAPAAKPKPAQATGPEPVRHKVVRGETAYTISRLYQVPVKSLGEWNGLGSDFAIREGQYLLIPITVKPASAPAPLTNPGTGTQTPTPPSAVTPLPEEKIDPVPVEIPKVSVGEPSQINSNAAMGLPVRGKIIRVYKKGRNEGIDIAAAPGTKVTAAADGTVAAITQDAEQVPIVVIRHPDNVLTVYANVELIQVNKGDTIKRGQKIASLRSGDDAYVHFEVRNGFDSVDPMPYLE